MTTTNKINSPSFFIGKSGDGLISFGSGQPDLPPPKEVYEMLPTYRAFKYGQIAGQKNLKEALAKQYPDSTAGNFVITNGASEALDLTFRAIGRNGNGKQLKVLLPKPYYYSYPFIIKFAGMEPVYTDLVEGRIDFDDFDKKVRDCKAVLINSPSNPTGRVESMKTLKQIEKLTKDLGIYVISDEVYKDLIYTRENYLIKGDQVVTINSFSKTFAMCGFRVGYLWTGDTNLVNEVTEMKTHTSMNTNILGQEMAYEATKVPRSFVDEQRAVWEKRRDLIYDGMKELGLELWKPEGAFYVFPKMKNPNKVVNDLYYKYKVITYDGMWFGDEKRVRFSYALNTEKIKEGLKRLENYLNKEYKDN